MKMKSIISAFRYPTENQSSPSDTLRRDRNLKHDLVARVSRGSSTLQRGRYVTSQDVVERLEKIRKHNFR